ncbi:MAG: gamma-glutamyl-gamma-aminobutyrate hydrolase family protein [Gammaproteobacteria bacterium]|nr:gamma-glutamyl-gamma-aminobutyrate hydrolase family protein [Gammaproteobacteria bacterium]
MLVDVQNIKHKKPLIGITCCSNKVAIHDFQMVADKYINAAVIGSDVIPVLVPALGDAMLDLLPHLDGLYLTGSYSNMEPHHYGAPDIGVDMPRDPRRDHTNLALLKQAVAMKLPVLGVCRGFQEMNVALGGSLHQQLFNLDDMIEHREDKSLTLAQQYGVAHPIKLHDGGILAKIMKGQLSQQINSLHGQGVDQLASKLKPEATADDGLIEAFSLADNSSYYLGLQWHPEWQLAQHPFYLEIFKSFGQACAKYRLTK